jgi:hypothetical protein
MCRCAFGKLPHSHKEEVYKLIISKCLPIAKRRIDTCHVGLLHFAATGLLAHAAPTRLADKLHQLPKLAEAMPIRWANTMVDLIDVAHASSAFVDWSITIITTFL